MSSIPDPKLLVAAVRMSQRGESDAARRERIIRAFGPAVCRAHGVSPRGSYAQDGLFDDGGPGRG